MSDGQGIPLFFRKSLSERRYKRLLRSTSDRDELSLLESVFSLGKDGRYHYQFPSDQETAESAATLLRKIHRNKSGLHMGRVISVAVIISLPVLFNALFLDKLASRQLEKTLETLSRTDVTVKGLDIAPLKARISLERLGFASKSDPMVDLFQLQDIAGDLSWGSLSFRRFVLEELRTTGAINAARKNPAVYPSFGTSTESSKRVSRDFSGTDWIPKDAIPSESEELIESLRKNYEVEYNNWVSKVEEDIDSTRSLIERVDSLINEPFPESVDGWILKIEEGRVVAGELNSSLALFDDYKLDFNAAFDEAESAFERAKRAVESDLELIEKTLRLDEEILNLWLQSIINELLGPKLGDIYRQAASNLSLTDFLKTRQDQDGTKPKAKGRMKRGRIVQFPVRLPPRFSIESLYMGGEGVNIVGENIGVDHHLAGAPSHLLAEFHGLAGLDVLVADITVDGRTGAENALIGKVDFSGWNWLIDYEDVSGAKGSIGGVLGANTTLMAVRTPNFDLGITGLARLTDWKGGEEEFLPFVLESSPPLGLQFEAQFSESKTVFGVSIIEEYLQQWLVFLSDMLLTEAKQRIRQSLLDNVNTDLEYFDALLVDWNEQGELLDVTIGQLSAQSVNLKESIADWTKEASGGLSSGLLEGLGSLF